MKANTQTTLRSGFTLIELLIASTLSLLAVSAVFVLLYTSNILVAKSLSINLTGNEARNSMDRIMYQIQLAYSTPTLIDSTGAVATTGSAAGIKFDRYIGMPYVVTVPPAGLPATTTTVTFTKDTRANPLPPDPQKDDIFYIYTTAIISGTSNAARVELASTPTPTASGSNRISYTATLKAPLGVTISTAGIKQSQTVIVATLVRPTAAVVLGPATNPCLKYFDSYTKDASGNVNINATNAITLTDAIDVQGGGTTYNPLTPFFLSSTNSKTFVKMNLRIRSKDYDNYLIKKQADAFATFMGLTTTAYPKCNQNKN